MRWSLLLALLMAVAFGPIHAQTGRWDESFDFSRVRLIAAKDGLDGSGLVQLGLEFDVADGWNIYWRHPAPSACPRRWQGCGEQYR